MILAAGLGVRMGALTATLPKPLLPVSGKPLICWHLERLASAGYREVVVNTSRFGEMIVAALGDGARWNVRIRYSAEPDGPLETAGGIAQALPLLGTQPFLALNADVWLSQLPPRHTLGADKLAHLYLTANPPHHPHGDFHLHGSDVQVSGNDNTLTFTGVSILAPALFRTVVPGSKAALGPLLRQAAQDRRVSGALLRGEWVDVGTPERLQQAEAAARELSASDSAQGN